MAIEWDELPQSEALAELARGLKWRRELKRKLDALDEEQRGPGRPRKNGFTAPEGDLDREPAGDA